MSAVGLGAADAAASFYGLTFPDQVDGAQIAETHDFESTDPGLGYAVHYDKPGWTIDIYIYDLRRHNIPDDLNSAVLKAQLKQARGDIFELEKRGTYAHVKQTASRVLKDGSGQSRFLCEDFSYVHETMGQVDSFLCLTSWQGKFVKFRLTTEHDANSAAAAKDFMESWIPLLWP